MRKRWVLFLLVCLGVVPGVSAQDLNAKAPNFTGQTTSGEVVHLSDYEGKVVLLDFWASWCGPCREEMPFLIQLYEENPDAAFEIIAVNIDTELASAEAFLENLDAEVPFILLTDPEATIPPLYDLEAMPTSLFIDANGMVRFKHAGFRESDGDQYRDELQTLLDEG